MSDQPKHVFLIDGSGFLFRAFHALPPMTRDDGTPVNAVFGFTKMVMKLIDETDADYIAVIFDRARKTFRSEIYADYKANRPPPPSPATRWAAQSRHARPPGQSAEHSPDRRATSPRVPFQVSPRQSRRHRNHAAPPACQAGRHPLSRRQARSGRHGRPRRPPVPEGCRAPLSVQCREAPGRRRGR